jgi:alginate O-acetyltransferase complex protein AlgI
VLFDSPVYIAFLVLVTLLYWRLRFEGQNRLLVVASYVFYGWWDWRFLGLIALSTIVDYACARCIVETGRPAAKRAALIISIALNIGFLAVFKYYNFFVDSLVDLLSIIGLDIPKRTLEFLLPPGISFYTFQAIAYIVDVYAGRIRPAKNLLSYSLFISFFPHLIAGPIQRPDHLLPQVEKPRKFDPEKAWSGVVLIVFGLFQKCVVADNCSLLANAAFDGRLGPASLPVLALGAYAFAWQIYGDFAGYSNIARGSAQLLGFHFMVNFRQPYLATSLQDFWRRWHISLSTWLRDYLYIPLGGSRSGERQTHRNLILTMLLGGLWHGANWTYVVWGSIHGIGQSLSRLTRSIYPARSSNNAEGSTGVLGRWAARIFVFHVVCVGWVFFRANSVDHAFGMLAGISHLTWGDHYSTALGLLAAFSIPMFLLDMVNERLGGEHVFERMKPIWQIISTLLLLLGVVVFAGSNANAFIYFQF